MSAKAGTGRWARQAAVSDLREIAERLYGPAVALCGRGQDAEDLVHDTIEALLIRWDDITGSRIAFARRILANKYVDRLRRRQVRIAYQQTVLPPLNDQATEPRSDERVDLHRALMRLPERVRTVVVLRYLLDHSADQVAETLSIPAGTVRRLSHDGLAVLARDLSGDRSHSPGRNERT